jgi:hypothetical protein
MSDELASACGELATWLAVAETLIALPDIQPSGRRAGKPGSRAPGNTAVMNALMDAHEGVRRMEEDVRAQVSGTRRRRGGSTQNVALALEALPVLYGAVDVVHARENGKCRCPHCEAARILGRWALAIRQLPAVDDAPRWVKLRPGPDGLPPRCPHCGTFSLRLAVESGQIRCWFPEHEGLDRPPTATVQFSRVGGVPVLVWNTGEVQ